MKMIFLDEDVVAYKEYVEKNFPNSPLKNKDELKKPVKQLFKCVKIVQLFSRIGINRDRQNILDDLLQSIFDVLFSLSAYSDFNFNAALRSFSEQTMIFVVSLTTGVSELSNDELSKKKHVDLWNNYIKTSDLYMDPESKPILDDMNNMFARGSQVIHRDPNIVNKNNVDFLNDYFHNIDQHKVLIIVQQIQKIDDAIQVLIYNKYLKCLSSDSLTMAQKFELNELKKAVSQLK